MLIKKIVHIFQLLFIILVLIFEKSMLDLVVRPIYKKIEKLPFMIEFKKWANSIEHKYVVLMLFLIPFVVSIVLSFVSFYFFGIGMFFLGIIFYSVKIIVTVPAFIVYGVGKDELKNIWIVDKISIYLNWLSELDYIQKVKSDFHGFRLEIMTFFKKIVSPKSKGCRQEWLIMLKKIKRVKNYKTPSKTPME